MGVPNKEALHEGMDLRHKQLDDVFYLLIRRGAEKTRQSFIISMHISALFIRQMNSLNIGLYTMRTENKGIYALNLTHG